MNTAPLPTDLTKISTKFLFGLTKRQCVCFGCGLLIGVPLFFLLKPVISSSAASIVMIAVLVPFFLLGVYQHNGEPLEKFVSHIIQARFVRTKLRPYRTANIFTLLHKQAIIDKEVKRIVFPQKQSRKAGRTSS